MAAGLTTAIEKITQPVLRLRGVIKGALAGLKFGRVIKDFDAIGEKKNAS